MTARDLLQQRTTTPEGDTVWRVAPLVEAALEGRLAVLDGLHRAHKSSLAVLQRIVQVVFWIRHDLVLNLVYGKFHDHNIYKLGFESSLIVYLTIYWG
jgi:hypothetical protein